MNIDPNKIMVVKFTLNVDDRFQIDNSNTHRKIYIPMGFYDIVMLYSEEHYTHEDLAECYINSDPKLKAEYEKYKKKEGNAAKDFLVLNYEAVAVSDRDTKTSPEMFCNLESNSGTMKKIINEYLIKGYKIKNKANPMQGGSYGLR